MLDEWTYERGVFLDFIRPRKPVENSFIDSFNGKLRDERLNASQARGTPSALYSTYGEWCREAGTEYPLSRQRFLDELEQRVPGFGRAKSNGAPYGIRTRVIALRGLTRTRHDETSAMLLVLCKDPHLPLE